LLGLPFRVVAMTLLVHGVHLLLGDLAVAVRVHGGELLGRDFRPHDLQLGEADAAVAILVEAFEPCTVMGLAQLARSTEPSPLVSSRGFCGCAWAAGAPSSSEKAASARAGRILG
jgi:hypothetical protein